MEQEKVWYWSDLAQLTHASQVENFGWCGCEEQEYFPYDDCPRQDLAKEDYFCSWCGYVGCGACDDSKREEVTA